MPHSFWHRCTYESQSTAEEVRFGASDYFLHSDRDAAKCRRDNFPPDTVDGEPPDDENQWTWGERYNDWNAWGGYDKNGTPKSKDDRATSPEKSDSSRPAILSPVPETHPPEPIIPKPPAAATSPAVSSAVAEERFRPATQRVSATPSMSEAPCASRYQEDPHALQALAVGGPPKTLDDRRARQVYANRLILPPAIYDMLVFGEAPSTGN